MERYLSEFQDLGNGYYWVLKDSGNGDYGVEYLYNGGGGFSPVSRETVEANTNADPGTIEFQYAPDLLQSLKGTVPGAQPTPPQETQTPTTGGTGTGSTVFSRYLGGTLYSDPIAYTNAVTEASITEFKRQNKLLTDAYNAGLLEFGRYKQQLEQARDTIKQQYGDAMASISGRFSGMSPDAYQSAQGTAEGRAKDITDQNYANVAGQEADLGLQQTQYQQDYANNLESNRVASQNQIDQTLNSTSDALAGTQYANKMGAINAPKLNTMTPMDSSVLGAYDNIAQLSKEGNVPMVKSTIQNLNADPSIKDWLYTRFSPTA